MDIKSLGTTIIDGFKWAGNGVVSAASWAGKSVVIVGKSIGNGIYFVGSKIVAAVKFVWTNTLPFIQKAATFVKECALKAWPYVRNAGTRFVAILKTPAGLVGAGLTVGSTLWVISDKMENKMVEDRRQGRTLASTAVKVASTAAFIATGAALAVGISSGFSVPVL